MFRSTAVLTLALLLFGSNAAAQEPTAPAHRPYWQLIVNSGRMMPTGAQRSAIEGGGVTAAQLSYVVQEGLALTASFGWTRAREVADLGRPRLHLLTYDVGAEIRGGKWVNGGLVSFAPFVGAGAGGRSYDYRDRAGEATHRPAGYASAGGELGIAKRVTLRLEARDYLTGAGSPAHEGTTGSRNDLTLMAGLRLGVR